MKVDRAKAVTKHFGGETFYFCSEHCLHAFELDPQHSANARVDPIDGGVAARGWQK
jgi:YHS domain-containing protein